MTIWVPIIDSVHFKLCNLHAHALHGHTTKVATNCTANVRTYDAMINVIHKPG